MKTLLTLTFVLCYLLFLKVHSASVSPNTVACDPNSYSVNNFPGKFQLRALDPSTSATYIVAHYPQFSFDDPGPLKIFISPPSDQTSVFTLSNYSLHDGTARCSIVGWGQGLPGEPKPQPTQIITCAYNFGVLSGGFPDFKIGCHPELNILVLQMAYPEAIVPISPCDKFYVFASTAEITPGQYGLTPTTSRGDCDHYPDPDRRIFLQVVPTDG
ncbi:hypothetical protein IFR05_006792 [Cadophora sp. M221]|nr:hypothetical protein IFR05_006792 [Cadophora sp. M221]